MFILPRAHIRLTACIANSVALLISPPQRSNGSATVLARNHHRGVLLCLDLQCSNVDRCRGVVNLLRLLRRGARLLLLLALHHIKAGTLRHAVVISRATTTALGTSCTIAPSSTRACSGWYMFRSDIGGPGRVRKQLCGVCFWGESLRGAPRRARDDVGRTLEVSWP